MNTLIVGGHKVEVYSSIDELPMANYHKFNKFLMFESGLAPNADGVIMHLSKMSELLQTEAYEKLQIELQSTYQAIAFIMNEMPTTSMAFACMIYSINGKPMKDLSDETLREVSLMLSREKIGVMRKHVEELKKKTDYELAAYFKSAFQKSAKEKTALGLARKRLDYLIALLRKGKPYDMKDDVNRQKLIQMYTPINLFGEKSEEIEYDKQYERIKLIIAQKTNLDIKTLTVFQYYTYLEAVKEQVDEEQKASKRIKRH